jgi:hypothetical protein
MDIPTAVLSLMLFSGVAAQPLPDVIHTLRPYQMGVDRRGNLWSRDGSTVTRLNASGEMETVQLPDSPSAIDADENLGVLALTNGGRQVRVLGWDGKFLDAVDLPGEAASVCWAEKNEIVVAPTHGEFRAELWDVAAHRVIRRFGQTTSVPTTPGAHPAHATLLRYAAARQELFVLDSFLGELSVFDLSGKLLRHALVANPDQADLRSWLAEMDRSSRAEGKSFTPLLWSVPTMAVSADGSAWLTESSDRSAVKVARITPTGDLQHTTIAAPGCGGRRLESWREQFLFYGSQRSPQPPCVGVRRK